MKATKWVIGILLAIMLAVAPVSVFAIGDSIIAEGSPDWASMDSGTTKFLRGVWGTSSSDVYAVGDSGTILHYNGSGWSAMVSNTSRNLTGVWGTSSDNVYAVGSRGIILHYNGSSWIQEYNNTSCVLNDIYGTNSSDIYAVGGCGFANNYNFILHWNGTTWENMSQPSLAVSLNDVWCDDTTSEVFAAGRNGLMPAVMHYNGTWSWQRLNTSYGILEGVWGNASDDVFVVDGVNGYYAYHYNGTDWTQTQISEDPVYLKEIWGTSSSDMYTVGTVGTILHYNGSTWGNMTSNTSKDLNGIWGNSSTGDIFVAGQTGTILRNIKPWTCIFYLDADNSTEGAFINTLDRLGAAGSYSNSSLNVVAQLDRIPGNDDIYGDWSTCRRYYVLDGTSAANGSEIEDIGEVNMGDTNTLVDFVEWAVDNYPAQNYILSLGNHGWVIGMCIDETNDGDSLFTYELQQALSDISTFVDIDLIVFDMCLMSAIEVAYEIHEYVPVMVADEEACGYPLFYENGAFSALIELKANPNLTAQEIAGIIVNNTNYSCSWAASDTSNIDELASAVNSLAQAMISDWGNDPPAVKSAAQSVMEQVNNSVIQVNPQADESSHGLTIFFPTTQDELNDIEGCYGVAYNSSLFDFLANTNWRAFLDEFYNTSMNASWIAEARNASLDYSCQPCGGQPVSPMVDLYDFCENLVEMIPTYFGVWGNNSSNVVVVGGNDFWEDYEFDFEVNGSSCQRYDGSVWQNEATSAAQPLSSIWGTPDGAFYTVGIGGGILEWDGDDWVEMNSSSSETVLMDIWGINSSEMYAVGHKNVEGNWYAVLLDFDSVNSTWTEVDIGQFNVYLKSVWYDNPSKIFCTGFSWAGGTLGYWNGSGITTLPSETYLACCDVWGTDSSNVFTVGPQGIIEHYTGNDSVGCQKMDTPTAENLYSIWGVDSNNVFAVGDNGTILKYDGSQWIGMNSSTTENLRSVWGTSASNLFIGGQNGTILHFENNLEPLPTPSPTPTVSPTATMTP